MSNTNPITDAEGIRRAAEDVVRRPVFQIDAGSESGATVFDLLLRAMDWVLTPFYWLVRVTAGLPGIIRWPIVVGLTLVVVALIAHIVYTALRAIRGVAKSAMGKSAVPRDEGPDPADFERQAIEAARRGDHIGAVRLLFRAGLLRLELARKRTPRAGMTNREFLRRHRDSRAFDAIQKIVDTLETKWYGQGVCSAEDYELCRAAHAEIVGASKEERHADGT